VIESLDDEHKLEAMAGSDFLSMYFDKFVVVYMENCLLFRLRSLD
jgi:hypothetical protein